MVSSAIHRYVEQQAATRGDAFACVDARRTLSYRELNCRANAFARALVAGGFRRGAIAALRMERSSELVIALLGTLKAGGAYLWRPCGAAPWPDGVAIAPDADACDFTSVDVRRAYAADCAPTPNLPILTRGCDPACVLDEGVGTGRVIVAHATIIALREQPQPRTIAAGAERAMFELWLALMAGATVTMTTAPETVAA